ncbi:cupin domain-containing protein [Halolamina salifodinae]|uniref:Mannose-6-phosphate isomerase-like protein (Cupin superfamily) n=1 Tax=Halolamina salifodinae TaxID=1202767 RepID=A0A8T4GUY8_9EURY|nr:cupin domain-containing protein [Halolamina salifodinae]MBP1986210.1 mannose-6-phosphate isomerase-like protein (cupin superfamily) [Halolamina salifodinae]
MDVVDIEGAFDSFEETWSPRLAASLNGQELKVAKLEGEFVWHSHPDADELFWVIEGDLTLELEGEPDQQLSDGQLGVVPAGVEHKPVADGLAKVVLFEPAGTENTGDADAGERQRDVEPLED